MSIEFFKLKVAKVVKETKHAVSVYLSVPENLQPTFAWQPGQHIQVKLPFGEKSIVRSYSISNDVATEGLRITVKALPFGKASNFIASRVKAGQMLDVSRPQGDFVLPDEPKAGAHYYFYAAGSGITPLYSMMSDVLSKDSQAKVSLLYGNTNGKTAIFLDAIAALASQFNGRVTIAHCWTKPGWFSKAKAWRKSRVNQGAIKSFFEQQPLNAPAHYHFMCGPTAFMSEAKATLTELGVANDAIFLESFGAEKKAEVVNGQAASLVLPMSAGGIDVGADETLLDAMLRHNIDAPYSCESGVCGSCQCTLEEGKVSMKENLFLTDEEQEKGLILACQAVAQSDTVKITF
ncbi:2Fe-2S iron-sulfur cluster-binding protein [Thalassotalea euphylliae]|uniref:2Fe-2S iron-sulfur cluster-binding protein n=1 Tax=Thalassotalea euphylliae TaxID=1655234 RepID=UPI0036419251